MLIGKEDFDRVQDRLRGQQAPESASARRRPMVGGIKCASCGSYLVARSVRGGRRYYRCCNAVLGIFVEASCSEKSVRADALAEFFERPFRSSRLVMKQTVGHQRTRYDSHCESGSVFVAPQCQETPRC